MSLYQPLRVFSLPHHMILVSAKGEWGATYREGSFAFMSRGVFDGGAGGRISGGTCPSLLNCQAQYVKN